MSSSHSVEPLQPPILANYGTNYLDYTSHYLFYLRLRLSLDRDPVRLKRVRSRRHRYGVDHSFTRKVIPRIMTVEALYEKFQPKFAERVIGADYWMEQETSFGLPMLFPDPEILTPAPRAPLVDDRDDEGCMPQDAAFSRNNDDVETMLGEDEWIQDKIHEEPIMEMEYVRLTKNEIFRKFLHVTTPNNFKVAWEKNPTLREGHPVYVDLAVCIAEYTQKGIDARQQPDVLRRIDTWRSVSGT
jgi:hypothetical protein